MTTNGMQKLASIAIQANEIFSKFYERSVTSVAVAERAVVIDCALSNRRLALMTVDELPGIVGAAIGLKGTDQSKLINQFPLDALESSQIFDIMKDNFAHSPT